MARFSSAHCEQTSCASLPTLASVKAPAESAAHASQCSSQQSAPTGNCKQTVAEILSIQDERNRLIEELDTMLDAAERGEIPKEQMSEKIQIWRERESALHSRVDTLYNQAEAGWCL